MNRLRSKLTFANVVSVVAVFIALGGVGYAAVQLPKNSVGSKQIAKNAVRSPEAKNLKCSDFKQGQGVCSTADTAGIQDLTTRSKSVSLGQVCQTFGMPASTTCQSPRTEITASCEPGERAVGGGYEGVDEGNVSNPASGGRIASAARVDRPEPASGTPSGWTVAATGSSAGPGTAEPPAPTFTVYVVCAS